MVSFTCVVVEDSAGVSEMGHYVVVFRSAGMMLIGLMVSSKILTLMLLFVSQGLKVLSSGFRLLNESEIIRSLATSLHGKPPAILGKPPASQSLISEISEVIIIDSSEAR